MKLLLILLNNYLHYAKNKSKINSKLKARIRKIKMMIWMNLDTLTIIKIMILYMKRLMNFLI